MKHKLSVTLLLLSMFFVTQLIGIATLAAYAPNETTIVNQETGQEEIILQHEQMPYGLDGGETLNPISLVFSLIFAFLIFAFLMRYNLKYIIKIWFAFVIILSIGITIHPLLSLFTKQATLLSLIITIAITYFKIIKPNMYAHNLSEILIYPGVAIVVVSVVFIPAGELVSFLGMPLFIATRYTSTLYAIFLLILISLYDAWAVWRSGVMQKMAKYQMEELNIFGGFLFPSISAKDKAKIKKIKQKYAHKEIPEKIKKQKFKVNLAILGGGDVIFPIITAGILMWSFPEQILFGIKGLIPALFVIFGAFGGLLYLFINTEKGKAYPAMPYISSGIFIGMILWKLLI